MAVSESTVQRSSMQVLLLGGFGGMDIDISILAGRMMGREGLK